jgi:hypothetical protein
MDLVFRNFRYALSHLEILHKVFKKRSNYLDEESYDRNIYLYSTGKFNNLIQQLNLEQQLYGHRGRQMILADLIEYIFLGRGYYSMRTREDKQNFVKLILYLTNLLMSYEAITISQNMRDKALEKLKSKIRCLSEESLFDQLENHVGSVGLPRNESDASEQLDNYFDSILPKTAGGLWHELLAFIFLLRNDVGYIIPLLLAQRLIGLSRNIIPPDFLVLTHDKQLYGIEVGRKKEIQSGSFSLQTSIPTATIDTINSRTSDRCPICKRWIPFCDFVINNYSDFNFEILRGEVRCLEQCSIYDREEILVGNCPCTKYRRIRGETRTHTHHEFTDGKHYHYKCVLDNVEEEMKGEIIGAADTVALKTHYPSYAGLEELIRRES